MVSCGPKLTGISLSVLGWVLSVISCALPMWVLSNYRGPMRECMVFSYSYNNYEDRDPRREWCGLWMRCESHSTGQMQCRFQSSVNQELQTLRALSVLAIILGVVGVFINIVRVKCTNFIHNERVKARLMVSSGGMFITAALFQLVTVFWIVLDITLRYRDPGEKTGVSLYLGWAASVLMLIGGSILCCICPPEEDKPRKYNIHGQSHVEYSVAPKSTTQSSNIKIYEV
ncbi:claudin-4-like [Mugil cephalus]|uniref:claudin-4-like n=1 Tax=Mugil cephalus TaxID=48193 RepID=UPI001FB697CE|nr:claudin-4-like [Mugil cephalus]